MRDTYTLSGVVNDKQFTLIVSESNRVTIDNLKKLIEETIETKYTEQILFIIGLLKGILKETKHRNRDTMKLPDLIYELEGYFFSVLENAIDDIRSGGRFWLSMPEIIPYWIND